MRPVTLPADLASSLRGLLDEAGLGRAADAIVRSALPSVRLRATVADEEDLPPGTSKLGGRPDLPEGWSWPETGPGVLGAGTRENRPLTFIGQLDLAAVTPQDSAGALPDRGMLYFFADTAGFDPVEQREFYRDRQVLYHPRTEGLRRAPFPERLHEDDRFLARIAEPHREATLPPEDLTGPEEAARLGFGADFTADEHAAYEDLRERLGEGGYRAPSHRLLGHPQPVQHDLRVECELETRGFNAWDSSARTEELKDRATGWRLLLQVDSQDGADEFVWGDFGRLFYMIRDKDLSERRFEKAWLVLHST